MDFTSAYIIIVFVVFLFFPILFMCLKVVALCYYAGNQQRRVPLNNLGPEERRGAVYIIPTDPHRGVHDTRINFPDFLWDVSSPNSRSNVPAKDDKDLPSYEDVMRMEMADQAVPASITTPTNTVETVPSQPIRVPV